MTADIYERFVTLPGRQSPETYNFTHFRAKHGLQDARATFERRGIQPGERAPDFTLPTATTGTTLRLSDLQGAPVLLHFGSFT